MTDDVTARGQRKDEPCSGANLNPGAEDGAHPHRGGKAAA